MWTFLDGDRSKEIQTVWGGKGKMVKFASKATFELFSNYTPIKKQAEFETH